MKCMLVGESKRIRTYTTKAFTHHEGLDVLASNCIILAFCLFCGNWRYELRDDPERTESVFETRRQIMCMQTVPSPKVD